MATNIFCYGTLKRGEQNNSLLAGCKFVGVGQVKGCVLLDMGGCPGMLPGKIDHHNHDDDAVGEVYSIPDEHLPVILRQLDRLENVGELYIRARVHVKLGNYVLGCITYLYMPTISREAIVKGGDWSHRYGR